MTLSTMPSTTMKATIPWPKMSLCLERRPLHHVSLGRLDPQRQGRQPVRHQIHPEDLERQQRKGHPEERSEQHHRDLRDVAGKQVLDEPADVVVDDSPFAHGGDDRREVVVEEDHVRCLLRDVGPDPHGDADVGLLERGRVVHTVAAIATTFLGLVGLDEPILCRARPGRRPRPPARPQLLVESDS
jgi:hypothetical protein